MSHAGIIVLGAPRSGTTILRRLLDAHPDISAPGETYLLTACARFLTEDKVVDGMDVGVLNGLGFLGVEPEETISRLRDFAFAFRAEHAAREGKSRWCEKTAVDAFHVDAIERLAAGHVHFVCLVRHGLDVAASTMDWALKAQSVPRELHPYLQSTPRLLEAFSMAWADATEAVTELAERQADATLIRYEDFVEAPETTLRGLFDALGAEWDDALLSRAFDQGDPKGFSDWRAFSEKSLTSKSIGRWKKLSPDTRAMVADIVNPMLEHHGYEPVKGGPARSRADARKRYNTGLILQSMRGADS